MHPQSWYDALVREHERATDLRAREHELTLRRRERSLATGPVRLVAPRRGPGRRSPRTRAAVA
ncbi:MAG: hypothetical protein GX609_11315 [Actinomycetales bacterium]|nr:hypothetical protein [Actinomycetales bacterium]